MADWVLTAPRDLREEDLSHFFEVSHQFMVRRYGEENVLSAWVHLDETTPHLHFAFMPLRDGTFQAKNILNRADLTSFHGDLSKVVQEELGYQVSIELGEEYRGLKVLSALPQKDYIVARQTIEAMRKEQQILRSEETEINKRLERLRKRETELIEEITAIREAPRVFGLVRACESHRERIRNLDERNGSLRGRIQELKERIKRLRDLLTSLRNRVGGITLMVSEARVIQSETQAQTLSRRESFRDAIESAKRSAAEKNRELLGRPPKANRGRRTTR
jgi:chromosome segregation ATPase